jgi:hypothetical protein
MCRQLHHANTGFTGFFSLICTIGLILEFNFQLTLFQAQTGMRFFMNSSKIKKIRWNNSISKSHPIWGMITSFCLYFLRPKPKAFHYFKWFNKRTYIISCTKILAAAPLTQMSINDFFLKREKSQLYTPNYYHFISTSFYPCLFSPACVLDVILNMLKRQFLFKHVLIVTIQLRNNITSSFMWLTQVHTSTWGKN